ncbi:MAG: BspA family leucine-rich repeat surface protein [Bacilli bacterium]|nr:BspA family leucine-rich repeat surface protein [Bacilli bacterium]
MKDRKVIIVFVVLAIVFTILGGSLAYWSWTSTNAEKTLVTFSVTSTMSCSADGGGSITANNYFAPTDCDNATYAIKREVVVNTTSQINNEIINLSMDLNISNISSVLLQSDNFKYALTENANSCSGAITGGSFKDNYDSVNHTVPLLIDEEFIGSESKTYYLYIWLDKNETNSNTMNTSFNASLSGTCTDTGNAFSKVYMDFFDRYYDEVYDYWNEIDAFDVERYDIESISFVNEVNIPDGAAVYNLGDTHFNNRDDVVGWLENYDLKIASRNGEKIYITNMYNMFYDMNSVRSINLSGLNTSEVTNMANAFYLDGEWEYNCTHLDLGDEFYTSNVTNMASMFSDTSNKIILNLGNHFDTSNVTDMSDMFNNLGQYSENDFSLNLGNYFNTSKVTNMYGMFGRVGMNSTNFSLNLGNNFDTSNVVKTACMFCDTGANVINFNLNLGDKFNTSNVTNMASMFDGAGYNSVTFNLDLGNNFYTNKVTYMRRMFENTAYNTGSTFTLDLSLADFTNVTNSQYMFTNFPTNKATIYVKDSTAQSFILAQNNGFSASNVLIK